MSLYFMHSMGSLSMIAMRISSRFFPNSDSLLWEMVSDTSEEEWLNLDQGRKSIDYYSSIILSIRIVGGKTRL